MAWILQFTTLEFILQPAKPNQINFCFKFEIIKVWLIIDETQFDVEPKNGIRSVINDIKMNLPLERKIKMSKFEVHIFVAILAMKILWSRNSSQLTTLTSNENEPLKMTGTSNGPNALIRSEEHCNYYFTNNSLHKSFYVSIISF